MKKRLAILLSAALMLCCLCACKTEEPPKEDTPAPPAHSGTFVSECGTLEFNGDGESVKVSITPGLAEAAGLPEGEFDGTYTFTFHHSIWRYDQAERLRLADGDSFADFINDFTRTDEDTIVVFSPSDGTPIIFEKELTQ